MTAAFDHSALMAVFAGFANDPAAACLAEGAPPLSFAALHQRALGWAGVLVGPRSPVMIHGHKQAEMLIGWWACLLAGRPALPVESDLPLQRLRDIAAMAGAEEMLLAGSDGSLPRETGLKLHRLQDLAPTAGATLPGACDPQDVAYILCSSGTTGAPKGIQISYANLSGFVRWLEQDLLAGSSFRAVSGNVRYCFDVSLYELWASWLRRVPLVAMDHATFAESRHHIARYGENGVGLWVSTPSVAQVYLRDPTFSAQSLPDLKTFLFCGEALPKPLVADLWQRFPDARILNSYGPTECTVAVTSVAITPDMLTNPQPLPIGFARPGCSLTCSEDEIVIQGAAVGPGYLGLQEKQARAFPAPQTYRTGDRGYQDGAGLWYFQGRGDREVKIQGQRVDLNEIEEQLRNLPGIEAAAVELQIIRGIPRSMIAYLSGPKDSARLADLAKGLAAALPPALVPRFWWAAPEFRMNSSSKLDRAALIAAAQAGGISHVHGR